MTTTERLRELLKEYHDSGLSPRIGDLVPVMIEALPALLAVVDAARTASLEEAEHKMGPYSARAMSIARQQLREALANLEKEKI